MRPVSALFAVLIALSTAGAAQTPSAAASNSQGARPLPPGPLSLEPATAAQVQAAAGHAGIAAANESVAPVVAGSASETNSAAPGTRPHTESWTALALTDSKLSTTTFNAVLLGKTEQPLYTRELVRVQWRPGDPIDLYIVMPHGVSKPQTILYLYDYKADSARFQDDGWCKRATQGGYAAVGLVSALSGDRFHSPRPMKQWFVSELQEALTTSTHDVQMVLNYLAFRGDVDIARAGIIAQGSGGSIAILAAAVDPRIVALDVLNPWGDWPDWLKSSPQIPAEERAAFLTPNFLAQVATLDPVDYLPKLKLKALRMQLVLDDPTTPEEATDKMASVVPSAGEVVRYKDTAAHQKAWRTSGLSAWMRAHLQSDGQVAIKE